MKPIFNTAALCLLVLGLMTGCDSGSSSDDEQRFDVAQLVLEVDGEALVTATGDAVVGELTMFVNAETELIEIKLLRADGSEIEVSEENELSLSESLDNVSVVTWLRQEDPMTFRLRGKGLGQTTLSFDLFYQGQRNYDSPQIAVRVTETP